MSVATDWSVRPSPVNRSSLVFSSSAATAAPASPGVIDLTEEDDIVLAEEEEDDDDKPYTGKHYPFEWKLYAPPNPPYSQKAERQRWREKERAEVESDRRETALEELRKHRPPVTSPSSSSSSPPPRVEDASLLLFHHSGVMRSTEAAPDGKEERRAPSPELKESNVDADAEDVEEEKRPAEEESESWKAAKATRDFHLAMSVLREWRTSDPNLTAASAADAALARFDPPAAPSSSDSAVASATTTSSSPTSSSSSLFVLPPLVIAADGHKRPQRQKRPSLAASLSNHPFFRLGRKQLMATIRSLYMASHYAQGTEEQRQTAFDAYMAEQTKGSVWALEDREEAKAPTLTPSDHRSAAQLQRQQRRERERAEMRAGLRASMQQSGPVELRAYIPPPNPSPPPPSSAGPSTTTVGEERQQQRQPPPLPLPALSFPAEFLSLTPDQLQQRLRQLLEEAKKLGKAAKKVRSSPTAATVAATPSAVSPAVVTAPPPLITSPPPGLLQPPPILQPLLPPVHLPSAPPSAFSSSASIVSPPGMRSPTDGSTSPVRPLESTDQHSSSPSLEGPSGGAALTPPLSSPPSSASRLALKDSLARQMAATAHPPVHSTPAPVGSFDHPPFATLLRRHPRRRVVPSRHRSLSPPSPARKRLRRETDERSSTVPPPTSSSKSSHSLKKRKEPTSLPGSFDYEWAVDEEWCALCNGRLVNTAWPCFRYKDEPTADFQQRIVFCLPNHMAAPSASGRRRRICIPCHRRLHEVLSITRCCLCACVAYSPRPLAPHLHRLHGSAATDGPEGPQVCLACSFNPPAAALVDRVQTADSLSSKDKARGKTLLTTRLKQCQYFASLLPPVLLRERPHLKQLVNDLRSRLRYLCEMTDSVDAAALGRSPDEVDRETEEKREREREKMVTKRVRAAEKKARDEAEKKARDEVTAVLSAAAATEKAAAEQAEQARKEKDEAEALTRLCPVCLEGECDALLLPCMHVSCCTPCAKQLKARKHACPRCARRITKAPLTISR